MITLYSTGCPRCVQLAKRLDMKGIEYEPCYDVSVMEKLNIMNVPVLGFSSGKLLNYSEAITWLNEQ